MFFFINWVLGHLIIGILIKAHYYSITRKIRLLLPNDALFRRSIRRSRFLSVSTISLPYPPPYTRRIISVEEWRRWGPVSPFPAAVKQIVNDLKVLECKLDSPIEFGGNGGKLQVIAGDHGPFGAYEDKKHRATLDDPEKKFRFFSARQVACRLLGSQGLFMPEVLACYGGLYVFIYQAVWFCGNRYVFGFICILGIFYARTTRASYCGRYLASNPLHSASLESLKTKRSCGMNSSVQEKTESVEVTFSVKDTFGSSASENPGSSSMTDEDKTLHFILLDGTWNNSAAMLKRLKDHAKSVWGDEDLPCISLAAGASAMHKLRAAAAIGLLTELSLLPQLSSYELDKQADAVEEGLVILLDSLTGRRLRMGRSITRKGRNTISIC